MTDTAKGQAFDGMVVTASFLHITSAPQSVIICFADEKLEAEPETRV